MTTLTKMGFMGLIGLGLTYLGFVGLLSLDTIPSHAGNAAYVFWHPLEFLMREYENYPKGSGLLYWDKYPENDGSILPWLPLFWLELTMLVLLIASNFDDGINDVVSAIETLVAVLALHVVIALVLGTVFGLYVDKVLYWAYKAGWIGSTASPEQLAFMSTMNDIARDNFLAHPIDVLTKEAAYWPAGYMPGAANMWDVILYPSAVVFVITILVHMASANSKEKDTYVAYAGVPERYERTAEASSSGGSSNPAFMNEGGNTDRYIGRGGIYSSRDSDEAFDREYQGTDKVYSSNDADRAFDRDMDNDNWSYK